MAHYLFANSQRETDKPIRYFYVCDSEITNFEKTFFSSFIYVNFNRFKNRNIVFLALEVYKIASNSREHCVY